MIILPDTEDCTIIISFVWTIHRNVTDRQTDRRTDGQTKTCRVYCSSLHCEQCGHVEKI